MKGRSEGGRGKREGGTNAGGREGGRGKRGRERGRKVGRYTE
jgi:hypothetical protein